MRKTILFALAIFPYWMTRLERSELHVTDHVTIILAILILQPPQPMDEQGIPCEHPHPISASTVGMTSSFKKLARPDVDYASAVADVSPLF